MAHGRSRVSTPYEADIADQPRALEALLTDALPDLGVLRDSGFDRIVLTGMGSSHYAAYSTWRCLLEIWPTWWIPTSELLDSMHLVDEKTLVWITSQSGGSGEVVELLDRFDAGTRPHKVLAITNDPHSILGRRADTVLNIHSGSESTVSTKSYINTLVVHALAARQLTELDTQEVLEEARRLPKIIQDILDDPLSCEVGDALGNAAALAIVGGVIGGITARTGALITKEASKVPAEGYVGGAFRHGPFELAGRDEFAVIILTADADQTTSSLRRLSDDLVERGTRVVTIGPDAWPGTVNIATPPGGDLTELVTGIVRIQQITVLLALRSGLVPGQFAHGQKVTSAL